MEPAQATLAERLARLDLARAALAAAVLELAFDRLLPAVAGHRIAPLLVQLGVFSRYFAATLCIVVLAVAVVHTTRRPNEFGLPARVVLGLTGLVLVPLLGWALIAPMPPGLAHQVESSFVFFALACLLTGLRGPAEPRLKLGLLLLVLPLLARGYAIAAGQLESLALGRLDARVFAEQRGEEAALLAGIAAPLLLSPPASLVRLARRSVVLGAMTITGTLALAAFLEPSGMRSAAGVLGFSLPDQPAGRLVYLIAAFGTVWTLLALQGLRGAPRLCGVGFSLVVVSGYVLGRPGQLAETALGLLLVVWGQAGAGELGGAPKPKPIDEEAWLRDAKTLAGRLGGEIVIVHDDNREITRVSGHVDTQPVVVRVVRALPVDAIELVVGAPPQAAPEWAIEERPGTDEQTSFERRYRVRRASGDPARPEALAALAPLPGDFALWPGLGARWHARLPSPAPIERIEWAARALAKLVGSLKG
jgi:hypothetical protein